MSTFGSNWRELQLETLVDLSLAMGGLRPEGELVQELLDRAVSTLDAGAGVVATRIEDRVGEVRAVALPPEWDTVPELFGDEALRQLSDGSTVLRHRDGDGRELVAAPMRWQHHLVGVVALADKEARDGHADFTDSDVRFLTSLAQMGAAAVWESRTVAELERVRQRLEEENRSLRDSRSRLGFVGESSEIRRLLEMVRRVSGTDVSVLVRGESGTGKERVARMLHDLSGRDGPFVPLSCAALPESLLEAELFGIEEGVATGVTARLGKLELADGGTLFLDEVGDLPLPLQVKLLRVLQEREVERVGGRSRIPIDVRLVAATHRPLEEMVSSGEFREDLYYRLRVVELVLPPLRDRRSDIPLLASHFLELYAERMGRDGLRFERSGIGKLLSLPLPGNVRELENIVQAAVALAPGTTIGADDLELAGGRPRTASDVAGLLSLDELERRHVEKVLTSTDGNRARAARILGIDRSTLYRKLREWHSATDVAEYDEVSEAP